MQQEHYRSISWARFTIEDLNPIGIDAMNRRKWHMQVLGHGSSPQQTQSPQELKAMRDSQPVATQLYKSSASMFNLPLVHPIR
jgi:hypothetical protein